MDAHATRTLTKTHTHTHTHTHTLTHTYTQDSHTRTHAQNKHAHTHAHTLACARTQQTEVLSELTCPITRELMVDPVIAADEHTYERAAITTWLRTNNRRCAVRAGVCAGDGGVCVFVCACECMCA